MQQITAVTRCESCGNVGSLQFALGGQHFGTRLGVDCACGGRAMTVGRYGSPLVDGAFITVLTSVSPGELAAVEQALAELRDLDTPPAPEDLYNAVQQAGPTVFAAIDQWVRQNGGWFTVTTTLTIVLMTFIQAVRSGGGDVTIEQIFIGEQAVSESPVDAPSTPHMPPPTPGRPLAPEAE